ncbi:RDD family protein [Actinacidiphila yeochonensis]|uniref:RDD family protein n=1 Tax=Actinacidiphila yeochonensis TaxID=89050 RepID=UPI000561A9AD|nr:RDD family protein [Actinacidiphila yeochonensis]
MAPLAEPGRRVLARIIDIVIVLIPSFLLDWAAVGIHGDNFSTGRSAVGGVFTAGIGFLYEFFMTRASGQTVGKRMMGLRVAMLNDGSVPVPNAAAVRALILWLPAFCCSCFWFLIIGLTVFSDRPYKQGVQDKAAKTVVVQAT